MTLAPWHVAGPPPDGRSLELPALRTIVAGRQTEGSVCHCLDALALALLGSLKLRVSSYLKVPKRYDAATGYRVTNLEVRKYMS